MDPRQEVVDRSWFSSRSELDLSRWVKLLRFFLKDLKRGKERVSIGVIWDRIWVRDDGADGGGSSESGFA